MINVKDNEDGSFTVEWDENDKDESFFNDWTKEDFTRFFRLAAERENAKESGKESQDSNISEATQEDWEDFWHNSEG